MKVLVIGGNRFVGIELTLKLLARGVEVTLLNRGTLADPFGARVQRLQADRGTDAFDRALEDTSWDAVFDLALFDGPQTDRLARVLEVDVRPRRQRSPARARLRARSTGEVAAPVRPRLVRATLKRITPRACRAQSTGSCWRKRHSDCSVQLRVAPIRRA